MSNYAKEIEIIESTLQAGGYPLSEEQKMLMAGAMAVCLDKVYNLGFTRGMDNYDH